jgi:CRISPR-associated protein Cas2
MDLIVTYDVDTTSADGQKRLRKVAKICEGFGQRVQFSVFEIVCNETDKLKLIAALRETIDAERDSIRIYRLPAGALDQVEFLGMGRDLDHRDPLII